MTLKHGLHTIDNVLDDNDFNMLVERNYEYMKSHSYSIDDFVADEDSEYNEDLIEFLVDGISDFIAEEAVNDFGYKYGGEVGCNSYHQTAENMYKALKSKFEGNTKKYKRVYSTILMGAFIDNMEIGADEDAKEKFNERVISALKAGGIECDWLENNVFETDDYEE